MEVIRRKKFRSAKHHRQIQDLIASQKKITEVKEPHKTIRIVIDGSAYKNALEAEVEIVSKLKEAGVPIKGLREFEGVTFGSLYAEQDPLNPYLLTYTWTTEIIN